MPVQARKGCSFRCAPAQGPVPWRPGFDGRGTAFGVARFRAENTRLWRGMWIIRYHTSNSDFTEGGRFLFGSLRSIRGRKQLFLQAPPSAKGRTAFSPRQERVGRRKYVAKSEKVAFGVRTAEGQNPVRRSRLAAFDSPTPAMVPESGIKDRPPYRSSRSSHCPSVSRLSSPTPGGRCSNIQRTSSAAAARSPAPSRTKARISRSRAASGSSSSTISR